MKFTCISNASHNDWFVDNKTEDLPEIVNIRKIGPSIENMVTMTDYGEVLVSNISVPATFLPDNNGTELRCRPVGCLVSSPAILLVQGKL